MLLQVRLGLCVFACLREDSHVLFSIILYSFFDHIIHFSVTWSVVLMIACIIMYMISLKLKSGASLIVVY